MRDSANSLAPVDEAARLEALQAYRVLDTPPEEAFDELTRLAAQICARPIGLISLVDAHRQWFKSKVGTEACETPREVAFCNHTIAKQDIFVVEDAAADARFAANPMVVDDPHIRFYAGVPLLTPNGHAVGALCVKDTKPGTLTAEQAEALRILGRQVVTQLELRRLLVESHNKRITDHRASLEALRASEERKSAILEAGLDCIVTSDHNGLIVDFNPAAERTFGWARHEVIGKPFVDVVVAPSRRKEHLRGMQNFHATGQGPAIDFRVEVCGRRRDGSEFPMEMALSVLESENRYLFIRFMRDITDRKELEEQLSHQAFHDPLTDLANRALFVDRVNHALALSARRAYPVVVLFLDLDDFKTVNDSLGHASGDDLLRMVASRLRESMREEDTVARLGGDEFAVLLEASRAEEAERVARRVLAAIERPITLTGRDVFIHSSVGIATSTPDTSSADELLRDADAAMYTAKNAGKARCVPFESSMHAAVMNRLELTADLERAVDRGEFVLHYQPIVHLSSGELSGVEALVRWHHPQRGIVSPAQFIPLAEESGLILRIGKWVLEEALRQAQRWNDRLGPSNQLGMSVNLSPRQLHHADLAAEVAEALRVSGFDARHLTLEMTESDLVGNTDATIAQLRNLKELGLSLAIDDFGTGYSSLSYLKRFPIDVLKIDKAFVDGVAVGVEESALAHAIVEIGRTLRLHTVAEGIEDARQVAKLVAMGCGMGQGFHFSKPVPAEGIDALLQLGELSPV